MRWSPDVDRKDVVSGYQSFKHELLKKRKLCFSLHFILRENKFPSRSLEFEEAVGALRFLRCACEGVCRALSLEPSLPPCPGPNLGLAL